jgi:hypothetical protein
MHTNDASVSVFLTRNTLTSRLQKILSIKYNALKFWHDLCFILGGNYDVTSINHINGILGEVKC